MGTEKFVVCNADEGDPGAFMDRSVLESDPHRVLEGMLIAAYAVGASEGYIYVRAEYPLAIKRLKIAIRQAEKLGLLGTNICGTQFSFKIEIRLGAGAFVCGEETALIASIEGKRGTPRPRPPYPAMEGLFGPAHADQQRRNVCQYSAHHPQWRRLVCRHRHGKKQRHEGICACRTRQIPAWSKCPMGITLREMVFEIGGGIPEGRQFKAVQTGGPSGGCLPAECLDMPVDYESLARAGSIMGSGGMIVMDESSCMVDVAKYFMDFCMTESCGKCIPAASAHTRCIGCLTPLPSCATPEDVALLEELCDMVKNTSLCGLGQSAPNPVLSTLRYFADEYKASHRAQQVRGWSLRQGGASRERHSPTSRL